MSAPAIDKAAIATAFTPPAWASHVAVRFCGRAEPAFWHEAAQCYLDEDPAPLKLGDWAGAFKEAYWTFFPVVAMKEQP